MPINETVILKLKTSKLKLDQKEQAILVKDNQILKMVDKLNELDTC